MKKLYFLDEGEKNRILNLYESANKRRYLNEAADTPELKIAKQFYQEGAYGGGTDPDIMVKAIQSITSAAQFWKVNELVKTLNSDKMDIAGVINDEFEYKDNPKSSNRKDLDKISAKLKTLGIGATIKKGSLGGYLDGTFKINAQPTSTPTNSGLSAEATACIKQYNGTDPKPSKTSGWVYVIDDSKSTVLFSKDYKVIYRSTDGKDTPGQWSCEGNVLKITTTDGDSYANGKWAGVPADKTGDETGGKIADKPSGKTGNTQKLSALTQDVQKSIGGKPTGKISSQELDSILQRLEGNDVSGEVSQSLPTDASGKPDLDKILASLSQ